MELIVFLLAKKKKAEFAELLFDLWLCRGESGAFEELLLLLQPLHFRAAAEHIFVAAKSNAAASVIGALQLSTAFACTTPPTRSF